MFSRFKMFMLFITTMLVFTAIPAQANNDLQSVIDKYCRVDCVSSTKLVDVATRAATAYRFDINALLAIIHIESKYHVKAKNGSSVGLNQVHLRYHKPKFRTKNFFDVEDNTFVGAKIFRECLDRMKGNYPKAFGCYNGGGDKKYVVKATQARDMMASLTKPISHSDPLGVFIAQLD